MPRLARIVIPGVPHHVTQRGNRRERTFFEDADYKRYRTILGQAARKAGAEVWAYCLMPNHVHLIVVPADEDGLRRTFADAHRRYTGLINARHQWTGHLWQGRFGSVAMDEAHLIAAARYVALNPVRAGLVKHARDWPWSSVGAHLAGKDDALVTVAPLLERYGDFAQLLDGDRDEEDSAWTALRKSESSGRPVGEAAWLAELERRTGRQLQTPPRGRPPKARSPSQKL
jgi:REP-associated tyrosine transposase